MRARCINNDVAVIDQPRVRDRIRRSIHIDGPMTDLTVGREYAIQAVEERDGGLWFYVHSVAINGYPYPYPAEMFGLSVNVIPPTWCVCLQEWHGNSVFKRMSFAASRAVRSGSASA